MSERMNKLCVCVSPCVDAALLLVALLHVLRVGHLLPRRSVIHLRKGWVGLLWKKKCPQGLRSALLWLWEDVGLEQEEVGGVL